MRRERWTEGHISPQVGPVQQPNWEKMKTEVMEELSHACLELLWYSEGSYFFPEREGPAQPEALYPAYEEMSSDMRGVGSIRAGRRQVWRARWGNGGWWQALQLIPKVCSVMRLVSKVICSYLVGRLDSKMTSSSFQSLCERMKFGFSLCPNPQPPSLTPTPHPWPPGGDARDFS